jgi:hypothetical protein
MMSTATATRPKIVEPIQKAPGMTVVFREVMPVEKAARRAEYWKAEHIEANNEIDRLKAENKRLQALYVQLRCGYSVSTRF